MLVVELGLYLDKPYSYYEELLKNNGLRCVFECITHDIYYTDDDFSNIDNMSESQIKDVCIRVRSVNNSDYEIQHNLIKDYNRKSIKANNIDELDKELSEYGYRKVFDTIKHDYQWCKDGMSSKIQLQEIKDIGLLLYYDNKEYYEYDLDTQRRKLIDELNSYGFNFDYDVLGIDKLRTLYYKKKMYSKNQNG
jgi:hypothetical protein